MVSLEKGASAGAETDHGSIGSQEFVYRTFIRRKALPTSILLRSDEHRGFVVIARLKSGRPPADSPGRNEPPASGADGKGRFE